MIEIHINKNVGSHDPKVVLGRFTIRQTICLGLAAPICWAIYKYLSPILSVDVAGFLIAIPAAVAVAFGWFKPYGMRMEKFIGSIFVNVVLAPSHRIYKAENVHEKSLRVLETYMQELENPESGSKGSKKSKRSKQRTKYKISAEAVR